jgi:hypothetical protein
MYQINAISNIRPQAKKSIMNFLSGALIAMSIVTFSRKFFIYLVAGVYADCDNSSFSGVFLTLTLSCEALNMPSVSAFGAGGALTFIYATFSFILLN